MSLVTPRSTRCAPVISAVNMCVSETRLWKEQRHHLHLTLFEGWRDVRCVELHVISVPLGIQIFASNKQGSPRDGTVHLVGLVGLYLFTHGFLLGMLSLFTVASCSDPAEPRALKPTHKRAVFLIHSFSLDFLSPHHLNLILPATTMY